MPALIPGMCEAALAPTCSRVTMAILATLTANRACSASTTNMPATTLRNVSECFQARTNAPASGQANDDEAQWVCAHGDAGGVLRESSRAL